MSFAAGILVITIVFTPVLAAVLNLLLLRRLLNEKKAAVDFMLEITIHLRASSQRNNRKFNQTITTIQGLHAVIDELHAAIEGNQEVVGRRLKLVEKRLTNVMDRLEGELNDITERLLADVGTLEVGTSDTE
jgi:hypothetical protein